MKRKKTCALPTVSAVVALSPIVAQSPAAATDDKPDWTPSMDILSDQELLPGLALSDGQLLPDVALSDGTASPLSPQPSSVSDEGFVDDLFRAFADEDCESSMDHMDGLLVKGEPVLAPLQVELTATPQLAPSDPSENNRPDPRLMKRIEDSLSTLPRDMHELVANKLIDAISNAGDTLPITGLKEECNPDRSVSVEDDDLPVTTVDNNVSSIPLPLAAAALKTILSEYGIKIECTAQKDPLLAKRLTESLPVVPLHA